MTREIRTKWLAILTAVLCLYLSFLYSDHALCGEVASMPVMPANWIVVSDFLVPSEQAKSMSSKLGAELSSVRNTVYKANGKRVQINVIVTPDPGNAQKLMTKLRSMKAEEGLLRKGLIVYEFVGQNDVLPLIAEARKLLDSK